MCTFSYLAATCLFFLSQQKVFPLWLVPGYQEDGGRQERAEDVLPLGSEGHPLRPPETVHESPPVEAVEEQARVHALDQRRGKSHRGTG